MSGKKSSKGATAPKARTKTAAKGASDQATLANLQNMPTSDDIRQLALAMGDLSISLHEFVSYFKANPEIKDIPESLRELTKRISVLSTRL